MWKPSIKKSHCWKNDVCWKGYNLPKSTLTGKRKREMAQYFVDWWKLDSYFWVSRPQTVCQTTSKHWIQATAHCEDREACIMIWGCCSYYVLGLFISFQGSWISLSSFKRLKRSRCLMRRGNVLEMGSETVAIQLNVSSGILKKDNLQACFSLYSKCLTL